MTTAHLKSDELEAFVEKYALDQFPRSGKFYLVTSDNPDELDIFDTTKAFRSKKHAELYAESICGGNMDRRIICVESTTLVLGTYNRPGGQRANRR